MNQALKIAASIVKQSGTSITNCSSFETQKELQSFLDLHSDLLNALPDHIRAGQEKNVGSNYFETFKALQYPFISYGTKKAVQVLMFDDDSKKYSNIEEYGSILSSKLGFRPTFITETQRGYQFGIILKHPVFRYHKNSSTYTQEYILLKELKKSITELLDCDIFGSHRVIGVWRNPLSHKFIYTSKKYLFSSLCDIVLKTNVKKRVQKNHTQTKHSSLATNSISPSNIKMKLGENTKIAKTIKKGFFEGNRNNYLFAVGFKIVFEDRSRLATIENELLQINSSHVKPLQQNEVINIAKSVFKYSEKMYLHPTNRKRGRLSDEMWAKKIHGLKERRAYAGHVVSKERAIKAVKKVINVFVDYFDKGITSPRNNEVSKKVNLSVRQIQRYKKIIKPAEVFLLWIKSLGSVNIVIRAYVAPIEKRPFLSAISTFLAQETKYRIEDFNWSVKFSMPDKKMLYN